MFLNVRLREKVSHVHELAQNELEPELVDLMHDDEKHFVVRERALVVFNAGLKRKNVFDVDVIPIRGRFAGHAQTLTRTSEKKR